MTKSELLVLARVRRMAKSGEAKAIRLGAELSLAEVGSPVGVGPATVYHWENGKRVPHGEAALKYASVLDALVAAAPA